MNKYIPFLKAKSNEFSAIKTLEPSRKAEIAPFFDLPLKKDMNGSALQKVIDNTVKKISKHLDGIHNYFVDDYDIPSSILVGGLQGYEYFSRCMSKAGNTFIPVLGLDRSPARNQLVVALRSQGVITSRVAAIRLTHEDFTSYPLTRSDIHGLITLTLSAFDEIVLIIDNRFCSDVDANMRASQITSFCNLALNDFKYLSIIISGSSFPSSAAEIVKTQDECNLDRNEISIYEKVLAAPLRSFEPIFGDYTIVSPDYSDVDIPPESLQNVTAPKVVYSHSTNLHFVIRGGVLKKHARGYSQYNDMAARIISEPFYRGSSFSAGDLFLLQKANGVGKKVTPGSILSPTINAHISYMLSIL